MHRQFYLTKTTQRGIREFVSQLCGDDATQRRTKFAKNKTSVTSNLRELLNFKISKVNYCSRLSKHERQQMVEEITKLKICNTISLSIK